MTEPIEIPKEILFEAFEQATKYMKRFLIHLPCEDVELAEVLCNNWMQGTLVTRKIKSFVTLAEEYLCPKFIVYHEKYFTDLAELFELFYELGKQDN